MCADVGLDYLWQSLVFTLVMTCIGVAPVMSYLWLGSRIRDRVVRGQLEAPKGIGSRYARLLLSGQKRHQDVSSAFVLQLPVVLFWIFGLLVMPEYTPTFFVAMIPIWLMAVALPFYHPKLSPCTDIDFRSEEGLREILDTSDPVAAALWIVRVYEEMQLEQERTRDGAPRAIRHDLEQYLRLKQELMSREDEVGRVFKEAYRRFEIGSEE
ncbi:MAG: hypothetical protein HXY34_11620 [Candidatus Thorarchaeota archaeon]|nr:hypothetical protein [Candidatus Thorarchaeota archaeon]